VAEKGGFEPPKPFIAAETEELARQTQRRLVLIAEDDLNDPRVVTPVDCGGTANERFQTSNL
jgi:hypothetical protein